MKQAHLLSLAVAGVFTTGNLSAQFAQTVVNYNSGTGFATEFGTGIGYTNPAVALGAPATVNDAGPVSPFNSPYSRNDLVSLGVGGSLTVGFSAPILNNPLNPYGLDFIIFSSALFLDVDFPNGRTDATGSMFSQNPGVNPGTTRVWASADNVSFYELNPNLAPVVDGLFPTDGSGDPTRPVDPSITGSVGDRTLADLRTLYGGSAGGTGFDIGWAIDGLGQSVFLPEVNYVRVDVLQNRSEIDAFSAVVPEPASWVLTGTGVLFMAAAIHWRSKCRT